MMLTAILLLILLLIIFIIFAVVIFYNLSRYSLIGDLSKRLFVFYFLGSIFIFGVGIAAIIINHITNAS